MPFVLFPTMGICASKARHSLILRLLLNILTLRIMENTDKTKNPRLDNCAGSGGNAASPQKQIEDHPQKQIEDFGAVTENERLAYYENGPQSKRERESNRAVKGSAWLLGIVAVFAIAILFAWLVGRDDSPMSSRSNLSQEYALSSTRHQGTVAKAGVSGQQISAATAANGVTVKNVKVVSKTAPAAVAPEKNSALSSMSDADRIEEEAREVIHGDFGVNPGRKARLGADYAAVQARVNQLLQ